MNVVNIFLLDRPKNKSEINIIIATSKKKKNKNIPIKDKIADTQNGRKSIENKSIIDERILNFILFPKNFPPNKSKNKK